jgi:hypothetical protein
LFDPILSAHHNPVSTSNFEQWLKCHRKGQHAYFIEHKEDRTFIGLDAEQAYRELAEIVGLEYHEVYRRLADLKRLGQAGHGDSRFCAIAKKKCVTWKITE